MEFFYINICGFISRDKSLYETRVLDNSYLLFKFQIPTSESTDITACGPKITLQCPVPLNSPSRNKLYPKQTLSTCIFNLNILALSFLDNIGVTNLRPRTPLWKTFYIRNEYLSMSSSVCNFSFFSSSSFRDNIGSQIYIRGLVPYGRP